MSSRTPESSRSSINDVVGDDMSPSTAYSENTPCLSSKPERLDIELCELFAENVAAKIWMVAKKLLKFQNNELSHYPEWVPQTGETAGEYSLREADFWTCGFFPGSLFALLERSVKFPQYLNIPASLRPSFRAQLLGLARTWAEPLHGMATRTNTHDMAFIIQPALRMDWELTGNVRCLESVLTAAESLASRFNAKVGAIRSWDSAVNHRYSYTDKESDFLVIIDSMCNLDLLYYAGHHASNQKLTDIATTHAHTVLENVVRDDFSTFHLVNFNGQTGKVKDRLTNQGYKDWSTWSRYFIQRLESSKYVYPYVPPWDFDAPISKNAGGLPLRDTSAGMIAANGLLLLQQALQGRGEVAQYLSAALRITKETIDLSLSDERASFCHSNSENSGVQVSITGCTFDAILKNATACNHEYAYLRYSDHGLVYADYYFLEVGNKLMRMGLM